MSSRNRYLRPEERGKAPVIFAQLEAARRALEAGERDYSMLQERGLQALKNAGFRPDYFEIREAASLDPPGASAGDLVVLTAARIGRARLIDNVRAKLRRD
jgi:pantoate--beta-alanine ligase